MTDSPSVLIIIVTWNKQEYVVDLLNSLRSLKYSLEDIDVVVVDNASTDDTVDILKRDFPHVQIIENQENLGGTGGFNSGLAHAFEQPDGKYDYLWLLDNDVVVHPAALKELIALLESEPDIGLVGSTMLQLTAPSRINEMGAFVDLGMGTLILNRHKEDVTALEGRSIEQLQNTEIDLSDHLKKCRSEMDVDYVAAASLVIRAPLAKKAGLWDDYFIHFDDVEWCLRIAGMGHRIVVSARSLIWHLPAEYKVPTWVLYYDNRNVLYLLNKHAGNWAVEGVQRYIKKKCLYYALLGKEDLSRLHLDALKDYSQAKTGKKDVQLDNCYYPLSQVKSILRDENIKKILVPWTVDLQATNLQRAIVKVMKSRPDLEVVYFVPPPFLEDVLDRQIPGASPLFAGTGKIKRLLWYFKFRNQYDLIFQSDYQPILPLNLLAKKILYLNYEGASLRDRPTLKSIWHLVENMFRS